MCAMQVATLQLLEEAEFQPSQATAIAEAIDSEITVNNQTLATHSDFKELHTEMRNGFALLRTELRAEFNLSLSALRGEINLGISELRGEVNLKLSELRNEVNLKLSELRVEFRKALHETEVRLIRHMYAAFLGLAVALITVMTGIVYFIVNQAVASIR